MRRRKLLALLGTAGTAGCLRLEGSSTGTRATATTGSRATTTTARRTSERPSEDTENTESTTEARSLTVSSDWPQFHHDASKTGHHPETTGPTDLVERVWQFSRQADVPDHRDRENGNEWSAFIPVIADGTAYFSSQDDNVYAIDAATGNEEWRFSLQTQPTDPSRKATPAVANGTVFTEGPGGLFYALDAETGELQWRRPSVLDVSNTQPTVDGDTVYYEGSPGITAVDAADGALEWVREGVGWTNSTCVGSDAVFVAQNGPSDHRLHALEKATGETRWTLDGPSFVCSFVDGTVYTTSAGDTENSEGPPELYAIDSEEGAVRWRTPLAAQSRGFHPPAVAEGLVYAGATDGNVYAFDATTGEEAWVYETMNSHMRGSPVVVDGHVYFATGYDGAVFCVTAADGDRKWTYPLSEVVYTPTVVDGVVFVGDAQGNVHALAERA